MLCEPVVLTSGSSPWWCSPKWVGRSSVGGINVPAKSKRACMAFRNKKISRFVCWLLQTKTVQTNKWSSSNKSEQNCRNCSFTFSVPFFLGGGKSFIHSSFSGSSLSMWTHSFWGFTGSSTSECKANTASKEKLSKHLDVPAKERLILVETSFEQSFRIFKVSSDLQGPQEVF